MTKHECAVVTAYTDISMLCGDDLKYLYNYLSGFIGQTGVYTRDSSGGCGLQGADQGGLPRTVQERKGGG